MREVVLPRKDSIAIDVVVPMREGEIAHVLAVPRSGTYANLPVLPYKKVEVDEGETLLSAAELCIERRICVKGIEIASLIGTNYADRPSTHPEGPHTTYMTVFEANISSRRRKKVIEELLNTTNNAFFSRFIVTPEVNDPFNLAEELGSICSGITRYHINQEQRNHLRPMLPSILKSVEQTPLERFSVQDDLVLDEIKKALKENSIRRFAFLSDMEREEVINFRRLNPGEQEHTNYGASEPFERMFIIRSGQTGTLNLIPLFGDPYETILIKLLIH